MTGVQPMGVKLNDFLVAWTNPICPCLPLVTYNGVKTIGDATNSYPLLASSCCLLQAGDQGGGLSETGISAGS
ncbi:MAG: hypothetical protein AYP45_13680 [Candidatus Brocadia carolinensis]|uniref:Uncharacterized protein n=1 Tax=Candidatus Brocadia carolinensis TaxID=1004156 RepID=A0A1V4ARE8_9BACT|nr:MAG: hypothetical protein AYP45_13680 [Candidatus Brocadia caroliniensis]